MTIEYVQKIGASISIGLSNGAGLELDVLMEAVAVAFDISHEDFADFDNDASSAGGQNNVLPANQSRPSAASASRRLVGSNCPNKQLVKYQIVVPPHAIDEKLQRAEELLTNGPAFRRLLHTVRNKSTQNSNVSVCMVSVVPHSVFFNEIARFPNRSIVVNDLTKVSITRNSSTITTTKSMPPTTKTITSGYGAVEHARGNNDAADEHDDDKVDIVVPAVGGSLGGFLCCSILMFAARRLWKASRKNPAAPEITPATPQASRHLHLRKTESTLSAFLARVESDAKAEEMLEETAQEANDQPSTPSPARKASRLQRRASSIALGFSKIFRRGNCQDIGTAPITTIADEDVTVQPADGAALETLETVIEDADIVIEPVTGDDGGDGPDAAEEEPPPLTTMELVNATESGRRVFLM